MIRIELENTVIYAQDATELLDFVIDPKFGISPYDRSTDGSLVADLIEPVVIAMDAKCDGSCDDDTCSASPDGHSESWYDAYGCHQCGQKACIACLKRSILE